MTTVLTEYELTAIVNAYHHSTREAMRATEAAVLAKRPTLCHAGCNSLQMIPEATARERERAAWDASQAFMWGRSLAFKDWAVSGEAARTERDARYPLPIPEVVGPSGRRYKANHGWLDSWVADHIGWHKVESVPVEDAATVAKLMEGK